MSDKRETMPSEVKINIDLSDQDIYDAMKQIPGYIDITTEDFRELYHLAHEHAIKRLVGSFQLSEIMTRSTETVRPQTPLNEAARVMATHRISTIPVVNGNDKVVGILSETDFLRCLGADTTMQLLIKFTGDATAIDQKCQATHVDNIMSTPPITISENANALPLIHILKTHPFSHIPVVNAAGNLAGMIARSDFVHFYRLEVMM
ncbi:MAG: CBS domain-containing protein [Gammaproteobacteria bacterium]|nr:CBS domain-containing protein [Gammaproteobacteria bacterium]